MKMSHSDKPHNHNVKQNKPEPKELIQPKWNYTFVKDVQTQTQLAYGIKSQENY